MMHVHTNIKHVNPLLYSIAVARYYTFAQKNTKYACTFCFSYLLIVLTAAEIMSQNTTVIAFCEPRKEIKCKTSFVFVYALE